MMVSGVYIVTGTSRGFGRALQEEILSRGQGLYSISRNPDSIQGRHVHYSCDLRQSAQVGRVFDRIARRLRGVSIDQLVLINNAGVLDPVGPIERADPQSIRDHLAVNLAAPIQLTAHFIRSTQGLRGRRILNISSGAAEHPYAGWGLYCAAKAAINQFTRCIALEQSGRQDAVGICAVAPGVLATDMQRRIRETTADEFPSRDRFEQLHAQGRLTAPREAAALLLDLDASGALESGGLYDLRDATWQDGRPSIKPRVL